MALLVAAKNIGAPIVAAHCNFHLRGEESDRDQKFVEELCARLDVDLKIMHFDVQKYRDLKGGSMEMACRELRYEWFEKLIGELECDRILTAHHADDNVVRCCVYTAGILKNISCRRARHGLWIPQT